MADMIIAHDILLEDVVAFVITRTFVGFDGIPIVNESEEPHKREYPYRFYVYDEYGVEIAIGRCDTYGTDAMLGMFDPRFGADSVSYE